LQLGFRPRYCLEDTRYLGVDFFAFPMSCFCDIPISRIREHTTFYGEYGLGMTKEWGQKNNLEPLIYTPSTGAVADFINYFVGTESDKVHPNDKALYKAISGHFDRMVALTKPLTGNMLVGGKAIEKDFYQENEWRYVPKDYDLLSQEEFDAKRDNMNADLEKNALSFLPNDVKYIFVKSDAEIPAIFDFIQNNLGHWPLNEIKILSSRITSLETVADDL
jgi:hypothetical protein